MTLRAGFAQVSPHWLDRETTLERVCDCLQQAAEDSVELLVFGEGLVPGYPFWVDLTDGARFESSVQKDLFRHYTEQAVDVSGGGLDAVAGLCSQLQVAIYLGVIERATDRSGHSLYASLVFIDPKRGIKSVHRKLCPTFEERLVWANGDGNGLVVHSYRGFRVGGLNCWENWMPLARASLYGQGENLHAAAWPGSRRNTRDITRFVARESRSFVISASGMLHRDAITSDIPHADRMLSALEERGTEWLADGGSCIAGPDGHWLVEPVVGEECVRWADLDLGFVHRERQNFDPAGHYSRPDVTCLEVDRRRQSTVKFRD
ncbi:MAG: carbon-nitrogen hydrolase family protein [Xanthomonadales bacterium]|nr:carbon-nitrogen hydrolase family protein [Xanthomonadales bacterium]